MKSCMLHWRHIAQLKSIFLFFLLSLQIVTCFDIRVYRRGRESQTKMCVWPWVLKSHGSSASASFASVFCFVFVPCPSSRIFVIFLYCHWTVPWVTGSVVCANDSLVHSVMHFLGMERCWTYYQRVGLMQGKEPWKG